MNEGQTGQDVRNSETFSETKPDTALDKPAFNLAPDQGASAPKVKAPVKRKPPTTDEPLPGQRHLFDKNKIVPRNAKQLELTGLPPPEPEKAKDDNEPLPGQIPLFQKSLDPVQDIIDREGVAYRRAKSVLQKRGYTLDSFQPGGPLYGKSTNELLTLARGDTDAANR